MDEKTQEFLYGIATIFVADLIKMAAGTVKEKLKKNKKRYEMAYTAYLEKSKEKIEKVKTLLYKQDYKYLYNFYECLGVRFEKEIIDTNDINNLFKKSKKIIITGTGGIGKTIMMKHCFINAMEKTQLIPIFVELRDFNDCPSDQIDIKKSLFNSLKTFGFTLEEGFFNYTLENGNYLIIFDGYDELKTSIVSKVEKEIKKLSDTYQNNNYIVSSRPMENNFVSWNDFIEMKVAPLTKSQALSLIKKLEFDEAVKEKFYKELENKLFDKHKEFAENPLLLTIMLMTFQEGGAIPEKLNEFYEQAFFSLFKGHDASKGSYERDKESKLGYDDFKMIFSHICFKSFFINRYSFTGDQILGHINDAKKKINLESEFKPEHFLKDLTNAVCLLVQEGLNYRFAHRSFQEYFAAYYTTQLKDDYQKIIIRDWLEEGDGFFGLGNSSFIKILRDLQPDRFIENVIIPGIEEIMQETKGLNDYKILSIFSDYISIDIERQMVGLDIKNNYYYTLQDLHNRPKFNKDEHIKRSMHFINEVVPKMSFEKNRIDKSFKRAKLSNIKDKDIQNEILKIAYWLMAWYYNAKKWLDQEKAKPKHTSAKKLREDL